MAKKACKIAYSGRRYVATSRERYRNGDAQEPLVRSWTWAIASALRHLVSAQAEGHYHRLVTANAKHTARGGDIGDFGRSRAVRREAALALTMSERLARVHVLCKQMSAIKGAASAR
jgi:hypothetical protein